MDQTPKARKKLYVGESKLKIGFKKSRDVDEDSPLVPPNVQGDQDNDYSPLYFQSTQEANEEIDVLWDWHSPQTSHKRRRKQKRLLPAQSPIIAPKRYPSGTQQNQNFEKLRLELKALEEELAKPDDESCLCISPQQEIEFKETQSNTQPTPFDEEDMFNDSIDAELLLYSQKIENDLNPSQDLFALVDIPDDEIDNLINKCCDEIGKKEVKPSINVTVTKSIQVTKVNTHTTDSNEKNKEFKEQEKEHSNKETTEKNDYKVATQNVVQTASGKLEFYRTKSFEMSSGCKEKLSGNVLEEIEKKKLQAIAKRESKQKQSPINPCSYQEIEKKRLEALAKREAKRIQDIVEKKRQEALKKLRMKNASQVRSTLSKRL